MITFVIPTINRADLLNPLLARLRDQLLDPRIFGLLVIDNGHQSIIDCPKMYLHLPSKNLGVSASWNFGINWSFSNPEITNVVALNDDIMLGTNQLVKIIETIEENPDKWMLVGPYYWSVWSLSRAGAIAMQYETGKFFDEHFYPAYFEDNDFYRRMYLIDPTKYAPNVSTFAPESAVNSGSIAKDSSLSNYFVTNKRYYIEKWGGEPHRERFTTPFNR